MVAAFTGLAMVQVVPAVRGAAGRGDSVGKRLLPFASNDDAFDSANTDLPHNDTAQSFIY